MRTNALTTTPHSHPHYQPPLSPLTTTPTTTPHYHPPLSHLPLPFTTTPSLLPPLLPLTTTPSLPPPHYQPLTITPPLPPPTITPHYHYPSPPPTRPENVPRLFDLVTLVDERYRPAFYYVLRDTLVADDIEQASRVAYGGSGGGGSGTRFRVVTLDGKLIERSGYVVVVITSSFDYVIVMLHHL